jgi:hypothetical protein
VLQVINGLHRAMRGDEDKSEDTAKFNSAFVAVLTALGGAGNLLRDCGVQGSRPHGHTIAIERDGAQMSEREDDFFGLCPYCHRGNGYANAGRSHRAYCREHKVSWLIGSNLFSSWRHETNEQQLAIWSEIGLDDFEDIMPFFWPETLAGADAPETHVSDDGARENTSDNGDRK